jgi:hypothetical protein
MKLVRGLFWMKEWGSLITVPTGLEGGVSLTPVDKSLSPRTHEQLGRIAAALTPASDRAVTGFYLNSSHAYIFPLMNAAWGGTECTREDGVNGLNSAQAHLDTILAGRFIFTEEKIKIASASRHIPG